MKFPFSTPLVALSPAESATTFLSALPVPISDRRKHPLQLRASSYPGPRAQKRYLIHDALFRKTPRTVAPRLPGIRNNYPLKRLLAEKGNHKVTLLFGVIWVVF